MHWPGGDALSFPYRNHALTNADRVTYNTHLGLLIFHLGCRHLLIFIHLDNLPSKFWYCDIWTLMTWASNLCSTLFILSMTFERFYSIIQPSQSCFVSTPLRRAKITILAIVCISTVFNLPHLFVTVKLVANCYPFGKAVVFLWVKIYYWISLILNFFLPFVLLLLMNSVIIITLQRRSVDQKLQGQGKNEGNNKSKMNWLASKLTKKVSVDKLKASIIQNHNAVGLLNNLFIFVIFEGGCNFCKTFLQIPIVKVMD